MSTAAVTPRSRPVRRPQRPIQVVRPVSPPARAPFIIAVLVLLTLGLGTLLLLNTLLAQGSFTLHTLNGRVDDLVDREQALQQRASELAAPQRLARRAQSLGMVPSENPAFLRADDGKILGDPLPAAAPIAPTPVVGSDDSTSGDDDTTSTNDAGTEAQTSSGERDQDTGNSGNSSNNSSNNSSGDGNQGGGNGGADR